LSGVCLLSIIHLVSLPCRVDLFLSILLFLNLVVINQSNPSWSSFISHNWSSKSFRRSPSFCRTSLPLSSGTTPDCQCFTRHLPLFHLRVADSILFPPTSDPTSLVAIFNFHRSISQVISRRIPSPSRHLLSSELHKSTNLALHTQIQLRRSLCHRDLFSVFISTNFHFRFEFFS
jgi:hypothetical protein